MTHSANPMLSHELIGKTTSERNIMSNRKFCGYYLSHTHTYKIFGGVLRSSVLCRLFALSKYLSARNNRKSPEKWSPHNAFEIWEKLQLKRSVATKLKK